MFLSLLDKHLHKEHRLYKCFNQNGVKLSYSCTKNTGQVIGNHNRKNSTAQKIELTCNCKVKSKYPLDRNCLVKNIVYTATIKTQTSTSTYVAMTDSNINQGVITTRHHSTTYATKMKLNCQSIYMLHKRKRS